MKDIEKGSMAPLYQLYAKVLIYSLIPAQRVSASPSSLYNSKHWRLSTGFTALRKGKRRRLFTSSRQR